MIQFGSDKIKDIYYGSDKIKEVYHGSDLVWKMDSGTIQDGYWVHKDTAVKTYFGADADFIDNGVMGSPDWRFDAIEVTLPEGLTSIGNSVFHSCTSLTSINLPYSLTSIGNSVFYSCTSLTSINLPDSLTSIGTGVFYSCTSLTSITLPEGFTSMGLRAFDSCTSLTSITFPDSLTSIGLRAFQYCASLRLVTSLPTIPPSLGSDVFLSTHATLAIKVPSQSVNAYKTATNWKSYASKISAI